MYFFFLALVLPLGACTKGSENKFGLLSQGVQTGVSAVADAVQHTIENTPIVGEKIFSDCVEPPLECPNENITFWYYTRRNPDTPRQILVSKPETLNLERNENQWKVIIHGYTNSKDKIPNPELRSAYFKEGDFDLNLISVDYEPLARDKCYIQAVHNVPLISKCTAQMIDALMNKQLFTSNNLHVIGFSLGAQIAGQIHEFMHHEKPRRVTGLDPASPLFDGILNNKLSKDSARFVDIIHTNGLASGKLELTGHVDFYVNGGLNQPGCLTNNNGSVNSCSHRRGPLYYAESINSPEGFWATPCSDSVKFYTGLCGKDSSAQIIMGEFTPETARGTYFLKTSDKAPYALGKSGQEKKSGKSEKSERSEKSEKSEKSDRREPERSDKRESDRSDRREPQRSDRREPERSDRSDRRETERSDRSDRREPQRSDRSDRRETERSDRSDRRETERSDRSDRRETERSDRREPERSDRSDRREPERSDRSDRREPERSDRSDRREPERSDRSDRREPERSERLRV